MLIGVKSGRWYDWGMIYKDRGPQSLPVYELEIMFNPWLHTYYALVIFCDPHLMLKYLMYTMLKERASNEKPV